MKLLDVFFTALRLGLTSFGGPVAHLSYFYDEYVKRKKWLSDEAYTDLVTLCQFLPGPASSQVGMAIGLSRAGVSGAILSWLGFTLPSAVILILFGIGFSHIKISDHQHWLHGLKVVAVAVVAQAVFSMAKKNCPDVRRATLALVSALIVSFFSTAFSQILVLVACGIFGALFLRTNLELPFTPLNSGSRKRGAIFIGFFLGLLITLPLLREIFPSQMLKVIDSFYRVGALVFGGGHVVLPLLKAEVVSSGQVTNDLFLAGYGLANAIPGPLFTFAAYLGAVSIIPPNGWTGAFLSLLAIFLPSFLLIVGILPFWEKLRSIPKIRQATLGLNAGVVGLLLAALYNPVWTSAIFTFKDFIVAAVAFVLLEKFNFSSWSVVLMTVLLSFGIY